jgi:hypothetical protein
MKRSINKEFKKKVFSSPSVRNVKGRRRLPDMYGGTHCPELNPNRFKNVGKKSEKFDRIESSLNSKRL